MTVTPAERSLLREWTRAILLALVAWLVLRTFVVEAFRIPSGSMENTLLVGDFLFVNKSIYGAEIPFVHRSLPGFRAPRRGDIIVFDSVEEPGRTLVKRVVGVPGDTLAMRGGALMRDGAEVVEPYAVHIDATRSESPAARSRMRRWQADHLGADTVGYEPDLGDWGPLVVPRDSLFVLGDNRENSVDSRYWGFLPRRNVRGRPMIVYFSYDATPRAASFLSSIRWHRILDAPE